MKRYFNQEYPGCPDFAVAYFANEIMENDWTNISVARAVELTIHKALRHVMTDYDFLLSQGVERTEARRLIQPKIDAMIATWKKPVAERANR